MQDILKEVLPSLTPEQRQQLNAYYELLLAGNTRMNLTAITEPREVAEKHFLDSLAAADYIPQNACCIDVGAGAGLPGIPLLIARPDIRLTMLDSLQKRVLFLKETLAALSLPAQCIHTRAEDAGRDSDHREQYDIALARAVAPLPTLLELLTPMLRVGGLMIAYKGKAASEEATAAEKAAKTLCCRLRVELVAASYGERALVLGEKMEPTPKAYPRKAGTPSKNPL